MGFSGQSFPALQFGTKFNKTKVTVNWPASVSANSGFEYRVLRFGYPRLSWQIPTRNLTWDDKETLLEFWNQMGGSLQSFLFTDPEHNTLANFDFGAGTQISAPAAPALQGASGTLTAGTYSYAVTALNAQGETVASTQSSYTLTASGGIDVSWNAVAGATSYNVYGRSGTLGLLYSTTATNFLDSGPATPGVAAPTVNGTGTLQYPCIISLAGVDHPLWHPTGVTITPSNYTVEVVNGVPTLVYPAGSAPAYGSNVVGNGTYSLTARFDSAAGYAIQNAAYPTTSAVTFDTIKLVEVFE